MQWHTPIDMFMFHSKIKQCRVIVLAFKFQPLVTPTLDVRQNSKLISLGLHHLTWLSYFALGFFLRVQTTTKYLRTCWCDPTEEQLAVRSR